MWQLAPHADIFEVDKILREREERLFENPKCRTVLKAHMDATSWIDTEQVEAWGDLVPELGPLTLTQQYEQYLGDDFVGYLDLEMLNAHGRGTGSLVGRVRALMSPKSQFEVSAGLGSKKFVGYSWQYLLTPGTMLGFTMQGNYYGGVLRPSYQVLLNQTLTGNSRISLVAAQGGIFACNLTAGPFNLNVQVMPNNNFFIRVKHSIDLKQLVTVKFKLESSSQEGVLASVGVVKEMPAVSGKLGVHLQAGGYLGGVVLKLHLSRLDYHLVLPVHLSHELSVEALLLGSILPSAFSLLVDTCLLRPLRKQKEDRKWRELLFKRKQFLVKKREEAELVRALLADPAERKRQNEIAIAGLVIQKAVYCGGDVEVDVTSILQSQVHQSQLVLSVNRFYDVLGFYDVAPRQTKELIVEYEFKGELHKVIIPDGSALCIPQKSHRSDR